MMVRIKQTLECRIRRHANAGALTTTGTGRSRWLRPYRRAGIVIPEEWTEIDVTADQLALLEADPHVEITAASAAETEKP